MRRVLTFRRARTYALPLIGLYLAAWIYELSSGSPPLYGDNVPIGGDYIAFHAAGTLLLHGHVAELYDRAAVMAIQADLVSGLRQDLYIAFRNPPFAALPFVPLAALDLVPGFIAWSVVSLSCLGLALWLLLRQMPLLKDRWRGLLVLVFAFAPVFFGLIDGQNATVSLLLYVLIYRALVRDQDRLVGFWAALGLFKPQLFFVFPLVLLARRSWSALLVYSLTGLALGLVSLAMVGADGLIAWLRILVEPESGQVLVNAWRMVSLKSFVDTLLPGEPVVALALYIAASALLLVVLFRVWTTTTSGGPVGPRGSARSLARTVPRHSGTLELSWVFTSLVAVLVDPHLVDYDLTVLIPAGILAVTAVPTIRWWLVPLYVLLVFRAQLPLIGDSVVQLSALVLFICLGLVWTRLRPQVSHEPIAVAGLNHARSA